MKKLLLLLVSIISLTAANAQTYTMGGLGTVSTCSGTFYDNGGAGLNYGNNRRDTVTFCPATAGKQIRLTFTQFDLESNWDFMYVYDGNNTAAPLIGVYTGGTIPGTLTSYNFAGCLTIVVTTDSSGVASGWAANISCINVQPPHPSDTTCALSTGICTNTPLVYSANYGTNAPAFSSAYDCLTTSPNPVWLHIQAASTGTINYNLTGFDSTATRDVDFIVWGPFASESAMCSGYSTSNVLDCSYSASNVENVTINVVAGQFYLILITNFSNNPSTITLSQAPGSTATTNCNIGCNVVDIVTTNGVCNPATNTDTLSGFVIARNRPVSGVMKLSVSCGGIDTLLIPMPVASDTIYFKIPNVTSTGGNCVITAQFTSNPLCTFSKTFTSPSPCVCISQAAADSVVCAGGGTLLKTTPVSGASYLWTGPNGFSANGQYVHLTNMTAAQTGWYKVTVSGPSCLTYDSVFVRVVSAFNVSMSALSDTICLHANTAISVTASPANLGPFVYQWFPSTIVDSPNAAMNIVHPIQDTTYCVDVSSAAGCVVSACHKIYVRGNAPTLSVLSSRDNLCIDDTVTLIPRPLFTDLVSCGTIPLANACLTPGPQPTVKIGTTTAGSVTQSPFQGDWHGVRAQYLYKASELQAMGLYSGTFTTLGFYVTSKVSAANWNFNGFTIKMGCTNLTALTTYVSGLPIVFQPQSIVSNAGLNTFDLTDPYNWDGSSNIIVEVCYDNTALSNWSLNDQVETSTAFTGATVFRRTDSAPGCGLTTGFTVYADRPNLYVAMCLPQTNLTYNWSPATGLDCTNCQNPIATIHQDATYQLQIADGNCTNSGSVTVHINPGVVVSAGNDTSLCSGGGSAQLHAVQVSPAPPVCVPTYNVSAIPYSPIAAPGTTNPIATTSGGCTFNDDYYSNPITFPFPFQYFCSTVNTFQASLNGYLTLNGAPVCASYGNTTMPAAAAPNNVVALGWQDMNVQNATSSIDYFVSGTAPNRILVVRYNNMRHYNSTTQKLDGQVLFYEGTNVIEMHVNTDGYNGGAHSQGIENANGTVAYNLSGRNNQTYSISSPDGVRFTPNSIGISISNYLWTTTTGGSFTPANNVVNPTVSPTQTSDYAVAVTFSNGCVSHDTVKVAVGSFPFTGVTATPDSICVGGSSQLQFNGTGAVNYKWSPALTLNDSTIANPVASPQATTTYTVTATNAQGCIANGSVKVNVRVHTPPITLGGPQTICYSDSVSLSPSGSPYNSYTWYADNGTSIGTGATQFAHPAHTYYVDINDGSCTYRSDTAVISSFPIPLVHVGPDTMLCPGGIVTLQATGGFNSYSWHGSASTSSVATVSTAGNYYLTVTDANSCSYFSDTATVDFFNVVRPTITPKNDGFCPGAAVNLNGTAGLNNYLWNTTATTSSISANTVGTYWYSALDANNCVVQSDTATVVAKPLPVISFNVPKNPICSTDTIVIDAGQQPGVTYTWMPGNLSGPTLLVTSANTYSVEADLNGCLKDSTVTIGGLASPVVSLPAQTDSCTCTGSVNLAVTTVSGTVAGYSWSSNAGAVGDVSNVTVSSSGVYTVTVHDSQNCTAVASGAVNLYCLTAMIMLSDQGDTSIFVGDSAVLSAMTSYSGGLTYSWTPASALSNATDSVTATHSDSSQVYHLEVLDVIHGCRASDSIRIEVISEGKFAMPTAFTPNGDGRNDRFYPVLNNGDRSVAKVTAFRIYNRWGQTVYDNVQSPGWDGTYNGQPQVSETYTYFIQVTVPKVGHPDETETITKQGSFLLWR
ncbi:MAG: gliding motility-associated C-terminal domain-containing protein [Chitinophagales bacterium]